MQQDLIIIRMWRLIGYGVYTNNIPAGAYRGFGVTQSCFATEFNLDLLAEQVGITPWEIRYRNAIRPGQTLPNGQIATPDCALAQTLEAVKEVYDSHPYAGIASCMKNSGIGVGNPDVGRCNLRNGTEKSRCSPPLPVWAKVSAQWRSRSSVRPQD